MTLLPNITDACARHATSDFQLRGGDTAVAQPELRGKSKVYLQSGVPGYLPDAWIIVPQWQADAPPIVCVHGIKRETEVMARMLCDLAEERGRTVVLPVFDEVGFRRYQRGLCKSRSDKALLRLMHHLRAENVIMDGPFDLSGFSGGAQFAHRFAWFYPTLVGRLALCAAGWYTFPDEAAFPYGMGGGDVGGVDTGFCLRANLSAFLDRRIIVRVGAHDNVVDKNTRTGVRINAQQGEDRVTRARKWTRALETAASQRGIAPSVDFALLNGCGHDFRECVTLGGLDKVFVSDVVGASR